MCQDNPKPLVIVWRSLNWPFVGKAEVHHSDCLGNQKAVRTINVKGSGHDFYAVRKYLQESREVGVYDVVVDLENMLNIFSTLLGFYCYLKQEVENSGGKFVLANPGRRVLMIIESLGLDDVFTITPSLWEAFDIFLEKGSDEGA